MTGVRVLVLGAGGMLGRAVLAAAPPHPEVRGLGRAQLDITDAAAVAHAVAVDRPDIVVNCAAYTKVDQAEAELDRAFAVNGTGPLILATACRSAAVRLVHISTDYVFDGQASAPYAEDHPVRPLSVYGASKLAGEQAVRYVLPERHLVVRTQWLFGPGGANFVDTILRLARERREVRVVNDQHGRPTYAPDLARALWWLIERGITGTLHVANQGQATWYDLAREAVARSGLPATVRPCTTEDVGRPAPRPRFSVLDDRLYVGIAGSPLPEWRDALKQHLAPLHVISDTGS